MTMLKVNENVLDIVGIECETCSSELSEMEVLISQESYNKMICDSCYRDLVHKNNNTSLVLPF